MVHAHPGSSSPANVARIWKKEDPETPTHTMHMGGRCGLKALFSVYPMDGGHSRCSYLSDPFPPSCPATPCELSLPIAPTAPLSWRTTFLLLEPALPLCGRSCKCLGIPDPAGGSPYPMADAWPGSGVGGRGGYK